MHRFSLRIAILSVIYLVALAVAGALFVQTFLLAQRLPQLPLQAAAMTATTPTLAPTAAPLIILPTPVPPTPMPTAEPPEPAPVNYHPKSGRYIVVWLPALFQGGARESFFANADIIDDISPFWYSPDASGRIFGNRDDELVRIAHERNIRVIPSIHNVTANPSIVVNVLSDPGLRARHVQYIVDEVLARNYDGIDIDYESLAPSLRPAYTAFIQELSGALRQHDKLLTVAVHAKSSDYGGLGGFQDWVAIEPYIDQLRIMTYDYHWRGSGPGPVAPGYWVDAVTEYAASVMDPGKVFLGIHFYGYDWPPGGSAIARPWSVMEDIINQQGATVNFMERNSFGPVQESYFNYNSAQGVRQVWFMTATGLASKIQTVQDRDLAGIAIWQLGYEKPEYWQTIREHMVNDPTLVQRALSPLIPEH
ncbi:MAG: glycoside hydrolase [Candidatus Viridilinea halotolerans]|uniref:Glycoside hydrolase n=1 Tax=Candidatus Viridilinea halotolerans TaxID=2491704 RepID=A0A426TUB4_9CHLR|nr:MAG: glycoside hydrolase [Candidatus Viridilinea halotolerans]